MAKIGTAHIEVKPVLNEEALNELVARIESAVRAAVEAGCEPAKKPRPHYVGERGPELFEPRVTS